MKAKTALRWLVALAFVIAACGGSGNGGGGADGADQADGGAGTEEDGGISSELVAARAESPDGLLPTDVALDLFSSIYGEVPGGAARFDQVRPHDATLAIRAVLARWDELDEETRGAIRDALRSETSPAPLTAGGPGQRRRGGGDTELTARVARLENELAQGLGVPLPRSVTVEAVPDSTWTGDDEGTLADATPMLGNDVALGNDWDTCRIRVNQEDEVTDATLAHEIFHCLPFELTPLDVHFAVPDWIAEGSADWAAAAVAGADETVEGHFSEWQRSSDSLYTMDYPALGYFWTIETMGADPWRDIPFMFASVDGYDAVDPPQLDLDDLARHLATTAAMGLTFERAVDPIWELTPEAVPPSAITESETVTAMPLEKSFGEVGTIAKTPVQEIEVVGERIEICAQADVGAAQLFGGDLHAFTATEPGVVIDAGHQGPHTLFLSLARIEPGELAYTVSVLDDDEEGGGCSPCPDLAGEWQGGPLGFPTFSGRITIEGSDSGAGACALTAVYQCGASEYALTATSRTVPEVDADVAAYEESLTSVVVEGGGLWTGTHCEQTGSNRLANCLARDPEPAIWYRDEDDRLHRVSSHSCLGDTSIWARVR